MPLRDGHIESEYSLSISTTFHAYRGIGTAQAHHTVSTAVLGIGATFHDAVEWDGWLRYHHESSYVGAGMGYVRGQIATPGGSLTGPMRTLWDRPASPPSTTSCQSTSRHMTYWPVKSSARRQAR